jgi:hypothetical protein
MGIRLLDLKKIILFLDAQTGYTIRPFLSSQDVADLLSGMWKSIRTCSTNKTEAL